MNIFGNQNTQLNQINSYSIQGGSSSLYTWSVINGEIIGSNNTSNALIKTLGVNCVITCITDSETLIFSQNVCIPNTQGEITAIGVELYNQETFYEVVYLNGTDSSYLWSVENGIIIEGQGSNKIKIYWNNFENTKIKVDVQNCNSLKLEKEITVCVPVDAEIIGVIEVNNIDIYQYSVDLTGTFPFNYNWIIKGGEIIGNNFQSTISVKWKSSEENKVILSCVNCGNQSILKELEIEMNNPKSRTLVLKHCNNCIEKCNTISGIASPLAYIKLYNQNNLLLFEQQADKRGVYFFENVCNVDSLYVTQTETNKLESNPSNILSLCTECETTPKIYVKKCKI